MYDIKKIWPKWEIVKTIGEGSFGKVFEIVRNEYGIEEHSALKVISIPQSDGEIQSLKNDGMTDEDTTEYFRGIVNDFAREIQLMSQLKGNSAIVAYEDFEVVEKSDSFGYEILIRMELLTGLPSYLRDNQFRVYDVIQLGIDMCQALEVCRELNIVHRDIKPDNIFVSSNGKFKLGDFGVARTIEKTMAGLSRKGTYSYMAPEIYNGNEYGFEADIYSLGIVLYKLLNNNRDPFLPPYPAPVKYNDKTEAMIKRIQGLEMPMPVNADEKLARIVFKACAHNPSDRYSHPKDLRLELESIALGYAELQSEVFSDNGINYFTNNSVMGTASKNNISVKINSVDDGSSDKNNAYSEYEDEGTMLLVESTEDETSLMLDKQTKDDDPVLIMKSPEEKSSMLLGEQIKDEGQVLYIEPTEDEGTMLLTESTEDKSIIINPSNLASIDNERAEEKNDVAASNANVSFCPSCNNKINPGNLFCGFCGYKLKTESKKINFCPSCGTGIKPGMKFCGKCGHKF